MLRPQNLRFRHTQKRKKKELNVCIKWLCVPKEKLFMVVL